MTNEEVLAELELMCKAKYDIQIAAIMSDLKHRLRVDIKAAQKNNIETKPSASDNTTKATISQLWFSFAGKKDINTPTIVHEFLAWAEKL